MKRRSGKTLTLVVALAALVVAVVTAAGIFPFRQMIAEHHSVDLAQQKLDALKEENARLESEVAELQTDAEVERLAREQFGLVRPGETAYVVVSPPDEDVPAVAATEAEPSLDHPGEQPWWRDLWNFLSGGDLVRNG